MTIENEKNENENVAAASFAAKQPHTDVTGYSRTQDIRVTETILGEVGGVRVFLRRQTGGGQVEFCQRCWVDVATGTMTCVGIPCPKAPVSTGSGGVLA